MSAEDLLETITAQRMLSEDVLRKLQQKIGAQGRSASARSLGKYLVDRGLLSAEKVELAMELASSPMVLLDPTVPEQMPPIELSDSMAPELAARTQESLPTESGKHTTYNRYRPKKLNQNEFDTPLMLIGGGAVVLLLLVGGGLTYLLFRESGDDLLAVANEQFAQGSYTQAIPQYEQFIAGYPAHEKVGTAQVQVVLARLRQAAEGTISLEKGLAVAQNDLPEVAELDEFADARSDLAAVLPKLAEGLVAEAQETADQGEKADVSELQTQLTRTAEALEMCRNTQYIPKSLRDDSQLAKIDDIASRIDLRRQGLSGLSETLAAMRKASDSADHRGAYALHAAFLQRFPEYEGNERLTAAAREVAESESQAIKFVAATDEAETADWKTPLVAELALANPWKQATAPAKGGSIVEFMGALYAIDNATGKLLWRRYIDAHPGVTSVTPIDADFLVVDVRRCALLRLAGETGQLRWRRPIAPEAAPPLVAGDRLLVGNAEGQLLEVAAKTGNQIGRVELSQAVRVTPLLSADGRRLYVVGDEACLYVLDASSLACVGASYLGHRKGAINSAPLIVLDRMVVVENTGAATSRMRVFQLDKQGTLGKLLAEQALDGAVRQSPLGAGRRVVVTTDRGAIYLWDFGVGEGEAPVTLIAKRDPTSQAGESRYATIAGNQLWIAGNQLVRYSLTPADDQLRSVEIEADCAGDLFAGPIQIYGNTLVHLRRRKGRPGVTVAAMNAGAGSLLWQTDLAVPPLSAPAATDSPPQITASTVDGHQYQLSAAEIRQGVSAAPQTRGNQATFSLFEQSAQLSSGARVLSNPGSNRVVIANPANTRQPLQTIPLTGDLAAPPAAVGDAWLAPQKNGQIYCYDSAGEPAANPFQPELRPQTVASWLPLATSVKGDSATIVAIDPLDKLHVLSYTAGQPGEIKTLASVDIRHQSITTGAVITDKAAVVGASESRLLFFPLPSAEPIKTTEIAGKLAWGPFASGQRVLLALDNGNLVCIDVTNPTQPLWVAKTEVATFVGEPLLSKEKWFIASRAGTILALAPDSGEVTGTIDCGQTLGSGPTRFGPRLLVAAAEGTVLVVNLP
jgi:outer membrane protein assembly factor BamB